MTFWSRLSRPRLFVLPLLRSRSPRYFHNGLSPVCLLENPSVGPLSKSYYFDRSNKFYSSSPQEKFQPEDTTGPLLNEQIKCQYVRLVTDKGHDIIPSWQALSMAKKHNLDLVVVDAEGNPPVCKIYDYNKEKYNQKVREKERNKNKATIRKGECKEVRFSVKTELKDLKMKGNQIKRLIGDGYRVKCVAMPLKRGKKTATTDDGEEEKIGDEMKALFDTLVSLIEDEAVMECQPTMKNGQGYLIVRHQKFGPTKKGGSDKSKETKKSSVDEATATATNQSERTPMIQHQVPVPETVKQDWKSSLPFAPPNVSGESGVSAENNRYARKAGVNSSERDQIPYNRYAERDPVANSGEIRSSQSNRYAPNISERDIGRGSQNNRYNRSRQNS